jgi:hypothetical protein
MSTLAQLVLVAVDEEASFWPQTCRVSRHNDPDWDERSYQLDRNLDSDSLSQSTGNANSESVRHDSLFCYRVCAPLDGRAGAY